jgi:hypothetical protein
MTINDDTELLSCFDNPTGLRDEKMKPIGTATIGSRNASTPEAFGIGGHSQACCGNGETFAGYIAELIIFNREVTGAERNGIEAYLNEKYGASYPIPEVAVDPADL